VREKMLPLLARKFLAVIISDQLPRSLQNARHDRVEEIKRRERVKEEEERLKLIKFKEDHL
jgi:hypothetical protein